MRLVGIAGRMYSGKTTVGNHLEANYNFIKTAFAEPLKQMLIKAGMCSAEEVYGIKTPTSRWLMQKVGTEIFRKQVDPLFWVNKTEDEIMRLHGEYKRPIVVDDIRFPEEAARIKHLGGIVIKLERVWNESETQPDQTHESEKHVDSLSADYTITCSSGQTSELVNRFENTLRVCGFMR